MKERYLTFYQGQTAAAVYDIEGKRWTRNPQEVQLGRDPLSVDLDACGITAIYASQFPDLQKAKFDRNRDGEIAASQRPRKITAAEAIALVEPKAKKPAPASQVANLKTMTETIRFKRPKLATDEVLAAVAGYRQDGLSWAEIGKATGINSSTVRKAFQAQQESEGQTVQNTPFNTHPHTLFSVR